MVVSGDVTTQVHVSKKHQEAAANPQLVQELACEKYLNKWLNSNFGRILNHK